MSSHQLRRRRNKLWKKNPHCYFCGALTVLPPYPPTKGKQEKNWATIEHLRSRLHPDRHEPNPEYEERTVLCCWQCNNDRNKEYQQVVPIELLRQKSMQGKPHDRKERPEAELIRRAWDELGITYEQVQARQGAGRARRLIAELIRHDITYDEYKRRLKEITGTLASPSPAG